MNQNVVKTSGFSSESAVALYESNFAADPLARKLYESGFQCGGCSFYAKFNSDYGLCCHPDSQHLTETVFEHFTCKKCIDEGWKAHSFTTDRTDHCRCNYSTALEISEEERRAKYIKDFKRLMNARKNRT